MSKIRKVYLFTLSTLIILSVMLSIKLYSQLVTIRKLNNELTNYKNIVTSPSPSPSIVPTTTPEPTTTTTPTPKKASTIPLHIDSIDYTEGRPNGLITQGVIVRLYDMNDKLLQEKVPSPYVQNGAVGTGGETVFNVLPSTYKIVSETDNSAGSCIMIVRSSTEYNSCAIYLVKK